MPSRSEKMTRWLIFNVLVTLVPLASGYFGARLDGQQARLMAITARGELLLVSSAIASSAVGELLPGGRKYATRKLLAGGSCILLVLVCSLLFATIQARQNADPAPVFAASIGLFSCTLFASFGAVYLAQEEEEQRDP